jgi:uncharacterized damage-inducible protein DinB
MHASFEHVRELFDFMQWADRLMLEGTAALPDEECHKDREISLGSIHRLLVHLMAGESFWLSRWQGQPLAQIETHEDYPTRGALSARWPVVHGALDAFLARQTSQTLAAPFDFRDSAGNPHTTPLGQTMIHLVDHGTYHRGQLNAMIKQAGGKPVTASYITYQMQKNKKA